MTTFYLQKSKRSNSKALWTAVVIVLVLVSGAFLLQRYAGGAVSRVALTIGAPFSSVYAALARNTAFIGTFFQSKAALIRENQELRSYIVAHDEQEDRFEALSHEYQELLSLSGRNASTTSIRRTGERAVVANVVVRPPQSPYDVLILDVGSEQGVTSGMVAYSIGGGVVGRVDSVSGKSAKVVMFSSVGEKSQAIVSRTGEAIQILGSGGGTLVAEVAQEMDIIVNDKIVLPQFGGLVVATVASVDSSVTSSFKKILLSAPVSLSSLRWVEVREHVLFTEVDFVETETEHDDGN
jgi:cell shape-determining protein MreC